ncbi:unnamed protein product [Lymnaea stagnalis]|uniref:FGGY carbohydrate kinase domain-containing protein n=1 Tax=Lymnaea stagnalis TaxID=6523 RepID=A0AAV2IFW2_LYMST
MSSYFIGVDVGTSSVRASVVNDVGAILSTCIHQINIWNPKPDYYQQSSENIWINVSKAVKTAVSESAVAPDKIGGIGFDATCSLVLLDSQFQPVSISPTAEKDQNIIMWMDHRAQSQTDVINATKHQVLNTVGGVMSLEMQPPKLMWLKQNLPQSWKSACHFFDLPDFLTWRASGSLSRSLCSLVCKWGYQAGEDNQAWDDNFLSLIGLEDLADNGYTKIGIKTLSPGSPCGSGLSPQAAEDLGLVPGIPVGTSLIDAHAGALACLGCNPSCKSLVSDIENCLVVIAGTSTCHVICSKSQVSVPGVWGPYYSAILPAMWINEGGQSATGQLIDFVSTNHSAFATVKDKAEISGHHVYEYLNAHLQLMADRANLSNVASLTHTLHVWPDFHGNRSPLADVSMRGMVCGLSLSATEDDLALLYLATIQALAYGTKHIVSEMEKSGHTIAIMFLCGGLRNNTLYLQTHADVLGLPVVLPNTEQSVILGAAMLGACASGQFSSLQTAMTAMGGQGSVVNPDLSSCSFHQKKYNLFLEMMQDQRKYQKIMSDT